MSLERLLEADIAARGAMTFRDFMARSLFDPGHGYYASGRREIGRGGDFFTSVSVGPVYGRLLARLWRHAWELLGRPERFVVCEQGAGDGSLARDVLAESGRVGPRAFQEALEYRIIEPFVAVSARQKETLAGKPVRWFDSLDAAGAIDGVFFSNELVDSFPVHCVQYVSGRWMECGVTAADRGFGWTHREIEDAALREAIDRWDLPCREGYRTEINLEAVAWMKRVGTAMRRGWVVTGDYGFPADMLYNPDRMEGTLRGFSRQERTDDLLARAGGQDLTADVNFSALSEAGEAAGLRVEALMDQHHFLVGIARMGFLEEMEAVIRREPNDPATARVLRQFKMLMHPETMGTMFKFLVQSKGIDGMALMPEPVQAD
jgi:SAM-dependent MidA family methyltransferase